MAQPWLRLEETIFQKSLTEEDLQFRSEKLFTGQHCPGNGIQSVKPYEISFGRRRKKKVLWSDKVTAKVTLVSNIYKEITWYLHIGPFVVGAAKGVQVLLEVGTAGQLQLIAALLSLTARVELHRQIKSPGDVNLVLNQ